MSNPAKVTVFSPVAKPHVPTDFFAMEARLSSQGRILDEVFEEMVKRGLDRKDWMVGTCMALRIALLAQSQYRTTYQILAARYQPSQSAAPALELSHDTVE